MYSASLLMDYLFSKTYVIIKNVATILSEDRNESVYACYDISSITALRTRQFSGKRNAMIRSEHML